MITTEVIEHGDYQEITGCVNHREVITVKCIQGKWCVSSAVELPWDIEEAADIVTCFAQTIMRTRG